MPAVPSSLPGPIWSWFEALLTRHTSGPPLESGPAHRPGCHRRRIPDRAVFGYVLDALVPGPGVVTNRSGSEGPPHVVVRGPVGRSGRCGLARVTWMSRAVRARPRPGYRGHRQHGLGTMSLGSGGMLRQRRNGSQAGTSSAWRSK